jgi:diguanylate cyclase (GGDEF)-like protein/PAS domain S-box-containing protein
MMQHQTSIGRRSIILVMVMTICVFLAVALSTWILYLTAHEQQRDRLIELAQSQSRLIQAVARFDAIYSKDSHPDGAKAATLGQIKDAHRRFSGFGTTGEFTLAQMEAGRIVFLLRHRHFDLDTPAPVPMDSNLAEPMRRALRGESGSLVGLDYRGVQVLAAYEPLPQLGWGIVAKIDLAEVQKPFLVASGYAALAALFVIVIGAFLFIRITRLVARWFEESWQSSLIVERSMDAVIVMDDLGVIHAWNQQAEVVFGFSRDEVVGRLLEETIVPEGMKQKYRQELERYLRTGRSAMLNRRMEVAARHRDGHEFMVELSIVPVHQEGGCFFTAFVRDISERKRVDEAIRESSERLQAILDNSLAVIYLKDLEGRYLLVNRRYAELLHISQSQVVGKRDHDYFPAKWADAFRENDLEVLSAGRSLQFDETVPMNDEIHHYISIKFPLYDAAGEAYAVCGISTDITERRRAEAALQQREQYLSSLEQISLAVSGVWNTDELAQEAVKSLLDIFSADRAWMVYPCDPDAPELSLPAEATRPEYPGAFQAGAAVPMDAAAVSIIKMALAADGPIVHMFTGENLPEWAARFEIKSMMILALTPKAGRPWLMGLHQCSHARVWTEQEQRLFADIGDRLSETLTGLLLREQLEEDVQQRQTAESALRESEERYRLMTEHAPEAILVMDLESGHFLDANDHAEQLFGMSREQLMQCGPQEISPPTQPDGSSSSEAAMSYILQAYEGESPVFEWICRNAQGEDIPCEVRLVRLPVGDDYRIRGSITDIRQRKRTENELRQAASVFDNSTEGIVITDARTNILRVNQAYSLITGYAPEEVVGKTANILRSHHHDDSFFARMWEDLTNKGCWRGEIWNRRKDGEVFAAWQTITVIAGEDGQVNQYISVFSDITEKKQAEERIHHLAQFDVLTDLPNRFLLSDRCEHALRRARREGNRLALLFLDLDRFKHINDSMGHPVGDALLQAVAIRLKGLMRDEDTVARLGGDEFVILLEQLVNSEDAALIADKLISLFRQPFRVGEQQLHISTSIGISIYPDDANEVAGLIRNADAAMYRAKESGRNTFTFYTAEMTKSAIQRVALENDLQRAVKQEALSVVYQPQVDIESQRVVGAEALVRWKHPERGMVQPLDFIPIAEDSGLIRELGMQVLQMACRQFLEWQAEGVILDRIAVNVSGKQMQGRDFIRDVRRVLGETGMEAHHLELEITESSLMEIGPNVIQTLDELRSYGVSLAIDDFGTGYSSLGYLKQLPVDRLKIDRSFVMDIPRDKNDEAIVKAVLSLGDSMQLEVIAEGVETEGQQQFLREHGCRLVQGYLFSRPMGHAEFGEYLRDFASDV